MCLEWDRNGTRIGTEPKRSEDGNGTEPERKWNGIGKELVTLKLGSELERKGT